MIKAFIRRFVLDVSESRKFSITVRDEAAIDAMLVCNHQLLWLVILCVAAIGVVIYISAWASTLLVQL